LEYWLLWLLDMKEIQVWNPEKNTTKLLIVGGVTAVTLGVHYGWLVEPFFGHVHWLHAVHGRFCYIPIVIAAAWFGLRGGLIAALVISLAIIPYILGINLDTDQLADEATEIVFYFAIALLAGGLLDRELRARRRAEEMRFQLERSQKLSLVGQIAAGMAHEIKNPLASIKGAVEIISDDGTASSDRDEFKSIVSKEIKRINGSLTDFLEFARPSEPRLVRLNLAEVVNSSLKQIQTQIEKRGLDLRRNIDDQVFIEGDREKIHQVLLNLLLNAVDASRPGTSIMVTLRKDSSANKAQVTIDDSGEGIRESDLPKVFEPFFTTKSSGTGLGLAIAKNIMDNHGGTITLENNRNGGATVTLTFPLLEVEEPA
jgi:signal transduction histidine kinase